MANYKIKCEVIDVRGKSGICPGSAKYRKGETYVLTARTAEPTGMCGRAFAVIYPMAFAMRWSEKMECERADYVNTVRFSRRKTFKSKSMATDFRIILVK